MMAYVKVIDFLNKPTLVSPLQFAPLGLPHYPSIHPVFLSTCRYQACSSSCLSSGHNLILYYYSWWVQQCEASTGGGLGWVGTGLEGQKIILPALCPHAVIVTHIFLLSIYQVYQSSIQPATPFKWRSWNRQRDTYNTSLPVVVAINRIDPSRIEEETLLLHTDKNCSCCG